MSEMTRSFRDPAPSRLRYRLHRLWLTPLFRRFVRLVLPALLLVAAAAAFWSHPDNRYAVQSRLMDLQRSVEERPEFMLHVMAIDGATQSIADDIREIVPIDFPISSFDLDLDGIQHRIAELDAVASVDVRVRKGGILQIDIAERDPAAVWRVGDDLELLDAHGHRVAATASRLDRPDLPLLAGQGAEKAVPEALALLRATGPVEDRVRGLVRVGERRWDLVLDHNQRILLPENDPLSALEQVMALHQAQDLLDRSVVLVDYRNRDRPILRLTQDARENLRQINKLTTGDTSR